MIPIMRTKNQGNMLVQLAVIIVIAAIGAHLTELLCESVGSKHVRDNMRFTALVFGLFLAPSWWQYQQLQSLVDEDGLTVREQREVDFLSKKGRMSLILRVGFFLICAALVSVSSVFPSSDKFNNIFLPIAGSLFFLSIYFVFTLLINIWEVSNFKSRLSRRSNAEEASSKLLSQFKKKKGNE